MGRRVVEGAGACSMPIAQPGNLLCHTRLLEDFYWHSEDFKSSRIASLHRPKFKGPQKLQDLGRVGVGLARAEGSRNELCASQNGIFHGAARGLLVFLPQAGMESVRG